MIDARQDAIALPTINPTSVIALITLLMGLSYVSMNLITDSTGMSSLYLLMIIQFTPFLFALTTGRYTFIAFVMFNHFMTYSVAKVNQLYHIHKLSVVYPAALEAIHELTICSVLIILSYCAFYPFIMRGVNRMQFKPLTISHRILHIIGPLTIFHTYLTMVLPTAFRSLEIVAYFVSLVLLFSSRAPQNERMQFIYRTLAIGAGFYHFLRTGMLVYMGSIGGALFIILCIQRKRRNLFILSAIALTLMVLQPVKGWYRNLIKTYPHSSMTEKVTTLGSLLVWKYFNGALDGETADAMGIALEGDEFSKEIGGEEAETTETLAKGFARIGDDSLERVLAWTPEKVAFWGGESYANIPFMFIPRMLWPDKPTWTFWNKFGREYGFLSSDDYRTSVAIGYLGEAFMNFGYLGMYTVAIFFGFVVIIVERLSYQFLKGSYSFTFACFLATLVSFSQSLGAILNSIVLMTGLLFAIRFVLVKMRDASPA